MEEDKNAEFQSEELSALSAIYGDDFVIEESNGSSRVCYVNLLNPDNPDIHMKFEFRLPREYPTIPPVFELNCPHMNGLDKRDLSSTLQTICLDNLNQPVLYLWIEAVKNKMADFGFNPNSVDEDLADRSVRDEDLADRSPSVSYDNFIKDYSSCSNGDGVLPEISSGTPLTDRKSTFQAHVAAPISNTDQVKEILKKLKENGKVGRATHNIYAYRIIDGMVVIQDCEDDGEHQAGGRLAHLLTMMEANNVLVVVSRWYGGIHLGTDRFKHINNVARTLLEQRGFGPKSNKPSASDPKNASGGKHRSKR